MCLHRKDLTSGGTARSSGVTILSKQQTEARKKSLGHQALVLATASVGLPPKYLRQ